MRKRYFFTLAYNNIIYALQKFAPMTFNQLLAKIESNYIAGAISDEQLVQIIELGKTYLNLRTKTNYAKSNGLTYNGGLKRKVRKIEIDKVTFIIDNE